MAKVVKRHRVNEQNGLIVRGFRKQNKYSLVELAKQLKVGKTTIWEIEKGIRPISASILETLTNVYGLKLKTPKYNRTPKTTSKTVSSKSSSSKSVSKSRKSKSIEAVVSERIKSLRASQGLTLKQFSTAYSTSPAHTYQLENGNAKRITIKMLNKMVTSGVDLNSFFTV